MSEISNAAKEPNVFEEFAHRISDAAVRVNNGVISVKSSIDILDGHQPTGEGMDAMAEKGQEPGSLIARINEAINILHQQLDSLSEQQERLSRLVR